MTPGMNLQLAPSHAVRREPTQTHRESVSRERALMVLFGFRSLNLRDEQKVIEDEIARLIEVVACWLVYAAL